MPPLFPSMFAECEKPSGTMPDLIGRKPPHCTTHRSRNSNSRRTKTGLFHFALADHGMLMLGPSESVARAGDLFEPISKKWRIFQKAATHQRRAISIPITATAGPQRPNSLSAIFRARKSQNLSPPKTKQIRNDQRQTSCL